MFVSYIAYSPLWVTLSMHRMPY